MRKALFILGALGDTDVEWMAQNGRRLILPTGTPLIQQGTPIESVFILLEGQLSVCIQGPSRQEIALLQPGEIVGEISFVDNRVPAASVVAITESRLLALPRADLIAELQRNVGFAARFYRAIAAFLADRLFVTTSRLGYGAADQDEDSSELNEQMMADVSLATIRFDKLLRHLSNDQTSGSFARVSP